MPHASAPSAASARSTVVRAVADSDMEAVTGIYRHHVLHGSSSFETEPPTVEEMRRRRAEILARSQPYLVAASPGDGAVLGYAYATAYRPRAAYRNTVENSVYIRPDCVGQGLGRLLLAALITECERSGFRQMVAVVGDSGNLASIRLHEALGFRMVGTLHSVGRKHGRWLDTVLLQRPLGAADAAPPAAGQA